MVSTCLTFTGHKGAELNQTIFLVEARGLHELLHVLRSRGLECTSRKFLREYGFKVGAMRFCYLVVCRRKCERQRVSKRD